MTELELAPDGTAKVMVVKISPVVTSAKDIAHAFINSDCHIQAAILVEMAACLRQWEGAWAFQCHSIMEALEPLPYGDRAAIAAMISTLNEYVALTPPDHS